MAFTTIILLYTRTSGELTGVNELIVRNLEMPPAKAKGIWDTHIQQHLESSKR